jgi:glycosyltransferase involved in cell wall biosynthesis
MKILVVIPTYNEKQNIGKTIDGLEAVRKDIPKSHQLEILVIDDNSPDGTADVVKEKGSEFGNVKLLPNREKKGLGAAYIKAFQYAIEKLGAEAIFEYDADGSHQPKYIPGMIKELDKGADVVVGSRYIPGGKMPADWGLHRKLISYFGNFIARSVLWTWQYKDMTSGFRVTKAEYLKKIDLNNLLSKQFAYKIHLYYALHRLGAKIVEFPIEFVDRARGKSKFPRNNIIDSLRVVFTLRWQQNEKLFKVMIVGGVGMVVQLIFFNILRPFSNVNLAQNLAIEAAIISNFIINNLWTFGEKSFTLIRFVKFNLASLGSIVIQNLVLILGVKILGQSWLIENALVVLGILIGLVWNYLMYTRVVWKTHGRS